MFRGMWKFVVLISEAIRAALAAMRANGIRTLFSLLGVTIGIFSIIAVYSVVDSLESSVRKSVAFLGSDVLYVEKWPWLFDHDYPWWKYYKHPYPSYSEFKFLRENIKNASYLAISAEKQNRTFKAGSSSTSGSFKGVSFEFDKVREIPIAEGRYFRYQESEAGAKVAIVGHDIAQDLYPGQDPIGKFVSFKGIKFAIIGVLERQGRSMVSFQSNDNVVMIPFNAYSKIVNTKSGFMSGPTLLVKGLPSDPKLTKLEGELTGFLRGRRGLRPQSENTFAINKVEMVAKQITKIFEAIGIAGTIIGSFALLVGGFGIANIMFVSVRERTNLIGIEKSLGAKNYYILAQFLSEAIFLSIIGGLMGMILVYFITFLKLDGLELVLSAKNIIVGISISAFIGIVSGIAPAITASRMNPVDAIRSK